MYNEHWLRILRYSAKNIWLLIFPLLRGLKVFALDADRFYSWLRGAWFDIAVLGVILVFGFIRWYFSRITVTDSEVIHFEGVLFKTRKAMPYTSLSTFTEEDAFYLRPFRAIRISFATSSGALRKQDMKLLISEKVYSAVKGNLPAAELKKAPDDQCKPDYIAIAVFSLFFSSSLSGAVYIAAFFFKGGDIARDLISVSLGRISEETTKLTGMLIQNIPAAAIAAGSFFLTTWILSFIMNILRYSGFTVRNSEEITELCCGALIKRRYLLRKSMINYIDLRQTLVMKLFRAASVNISCAGYGSAGRQLPVICPLKSEKNLDVMKTENERLQYRPKLTSLWQYIWAPVIFAVAAYPALLIIMRIFPEFKEFSHFVLLMCELLALWLIIIKVTAAVTGGICITGRRIIIRYSKGTAFHTVIAERSRLVKLTVKQTPFQRLFKKTTIAFYFNDKSPVKHQIKAITKTDAEEICRRLGYEMLDRRNEK